MALLVVLALVKLVSELGAGVGNEKEEVGVDSSKPIDEILKTVFESPPEDNMRGGDVWEASGADNDPVLRADSNQLLIQPSYTINSYLS